MALGSSSPIGEAWIRIRPTSTGFEAEVMKEIGPGLKAAEKAASVKVKADVSKATGPLDVLKGKLQSFSGKSPLASALNDITTATGGTGGALSGLATGGIAIAATAITAFALKGVADFQNLAGQVKGFQRVTQTTAEDSSRFVAAFKAMGIDVPAATTAIGRFSKNLETSAATFAAMGVNIAKTSKGSVDVTKTFLNVADAIKNSSDAGARNTLVLQAFGRQGLALLPVLNKGREGIQELFKEAEKRHALLSQDDLDKATTLTINTRKLKEEFSGLEREAGQALVPFLASVAEATTKGLEFIDKVLNYKIGGESWLHDLALVANPLKQVQVQAGPTASALDKMSHAADYHGKIVFESSKADQAQVDALAAVAAQAPQTADEIDLNTKAVAAATAATAAHKTAINDLVTASTGLTTAQQGLATAHREVATAELNVAEKKRALAKLEKEGAVDAAKVETARHDLTSATRSLASAEQALVVAGRNIESSHQRQIAALDGVTAAEQRLADLQSGKAAADDMVGHEHDLAHAQNQVRSATLNQHDAQRKLTETQASATATVDDLAQAQLSLDEANLAVIEANENLTKTQADLTKIQDEGKAGSKTLADAQKDLADKQKILDDATQGLMDAYLGQQDAAQQVADATNNIATANDALTKALAGDPTFDDKKRQARQDLAGATQNLADAQNNAAGKAADLAKAQQGLNEKVSGGLPDLKEAKSTLEDLVRLQPQAAAFYQPTIDQINSLISAVSAVLSAPTNINLKAGTGAGFDRGKGQQAFASGGYATGSFIAGEGGGPERVDLLAGGGAYVTPAHRTTVSNGGHTFMVNIDASFGPGSSYDDVMRAMRDVATGVMSETLQRVVAKAATR